MNLQVTSTSILNYLRETLFNQLQSPYALVVAFFFPVGCEELYETRLQMSWNFSFVLI